MKDIARDDHNGPIATATFTSIARYLDENHLVKEASVIRTGDKEPSDLLRTL